MRGLKLNLDEGGATLAVEEAVEEHFSTAQNAMVNIGTSKGSAVLTPEKGTNLLKSVISGSLPGLQRTQHAANFAGLDTLFFSRDTELVTEDTSLTEVKLTVESLDLQAATLSARFTFVDGSQLGLTGTLEDGLNN